MNVYSYRPQKYKHRSQRKKPSGRILVVLILFIIIGLIVFYVRREPALAPTKQSHSSAEDSATLPATKASLPNVQSVVDTYTQANSGTYSVVVTDLATETELAAHNTDEPYFAASIYKLYVAYLGYLDIQNGRHTLDDPFLGGWSRKECLDKMIRESHSPCAEKMWVEQGKEESTERLGDQFKLSGTSMVGLTTTAHDVNIILARLYARKDLNEAHTNLYLESLKNNIYRDVIPVALPDLTVYDKVGFNGLVEYHDVGIVKLENGREVAVTLLSRNAGTRRLVALTQAIFNPLSATNQ